MIHQLSHHTHNQLLTPLLLAADRGHTDICQLIIDNVSDPCTDKNPCNKDGNTPLDFAVLNGHTEVCQLRRTENIRKD